MKLARQRLYSHCSLVRGRVVVWTVMKLDIYSFCCDLIHSCDIVSEKGDTIKAFSRTSWGSSLFVSGKQNQNMTNLLF